MAQLAYIGLGNMGKVGVFFINLEIIYPSRSILISV